MKTFQSACCRCFPIGFPPKVICLAIGNASNAATAALLLDHVDAIEAFTTHPEAGFLLLSPVAKP